MNDKTPNFAQVMSEEEFIEKCSNDFDAILAITKYGPILIERDGGNLVMMTYEMYESLRSYENSCL